jgi:aspartyl-tRNA(Asn)/glutamyl-tRNA(Gln) amidotransferase subunit B
MDDANALAETVASILQQNGDQVAQIRAGKVALVKWFVGCIMKATEGRANPEQAEAEVKKQLGL